VPPFGEQGPVEVGEAVFFFCQKYETAEGIPKERTGGGGANSGSGSSSSSGSGSGSG
jgi:hypothetical protein